MIPHGSKSKTGKTTIVKIIKYNNIIGDVIMKPIVKTTQPSSSTTIPPEEQKQSAKEKKESEDNNTSSDEDNSKDADWRKNVTLVNDTWKTGDFFHEVEGNRSYTSYILEVDPVTGVKILHPAFYSLPLAVTRHFTDPVKYLTPIFKSYRAYHAPPTLELDTVIHQPLLQRITGGRIIHPSRQVAYCIVNRVYKILKPKVPSYYHFLKVPTTDQKKKSEENEQTTTASENTLIHSTSSSKEQSKKSEIKKCKTTASEETKDDNDDDSESDDDPENYFRAQTWTVLNDQTPQVYLDNTSVLIIDPNTEECRLSHIRQCNIDVPNYLRDLSYGDNISLTNLPSENMCHGFSEVFICCIYDNHFSEFNMVWKEHKGKDLFQAFEIQYGKKKSSVTDVNPSDEMKNDETTKDGVITHIVTHGHIYPTSTSIGFHVFKQDVVYPLRETSRGPYDGVPLWVTNKPVKFGGFVGEFRGVIDQDSIVYAIDKKEKEKNKRAKTTLTTE